MGRSPPDYRLRREPGRAGATLPSQRRAHLQDLAVRTPSPACGGRWRRSRREGAGRLRRARPDTLRRRSNLRALRDQVLGDIVEACIVHVIELGVEATELHQLV